MRPSDLQRTQRRRTADALAARREPAKPPSKVAFLIVRPFEETTYPDEPLRVFACYVARVEFEESEGADVTFDPADPDPGDVVYVGNVGTKIPPEGEERLAVSYKGRWLMQFNGGDSA